MSMFGKRVTDIVRKLTRPRIIKTANATAAGMGRRIDQAETLSRMGMSLLAARGRRRFGNRPHPVARPQERGGARHDALARVDAAPDLDQIAVDDARLHLPLFDLAVAHDVEPRRIALALERGRRRADAVAAGELDLARGEGADMGVSDVLERDPDLAGAARLVDLLVDEADPARDRAFDPRQLQFRRDADEEPGQRLLGHVG